MSNIVTERKRVLEAGERTAKIYTVGGHYGVFKVNPIGTNIKKLKLAKRYVAINGLCTLRDKDLFKEIHYYDNKNGPTVYIITKNDIIIYVCVSHIYAPASSAYEILTDTMQGYKKGESGVWAFYTNDTIPTKVYEEPKSYHDGREFEVYINDTEEFNEIFEGLYKHY